MTLVHGITPEEEARIERALQVPPSPGQHFKDHHLAKLRRIYEGLLAIEAWRHEKPKADKARKGLGRLARAHDNLAAAYRDLDQFTRQLVEAQLRDAGLLGPTTGLLADHGPAATAELMAEALEDLRGQLTGPAGRPAAKHLRQAIRDMASLWQDATGQNPRQTQKAWGSNQRFATRVTFRDFVNDVLKALGGAAETGRFTEDVTKAVQVALR